MDCKSPLAYEHDEGAAQGHSVQVKQGHALEVALVPLKADLRSLSSRQKQMVRLLIEASRKMDHIYWLQTCCDPAKPLFDDSVVPDSRFKIHYGPWNRFKGDAPLYPGVAKKPAGAFFYPINVNKQEVTRAAARFPALKAPFTLVRRGKGGALLAIPYHLAYREQREAAKLLMEAAEHAEHVAFGSYLRARAKALSTDDYQASDRAWTALRHNPIELIIGPIESYEDGILGVKTAHQAYLLRRDPVWSASLARYATMMPSFQSGLPVDKPYKREKPGLDSDLGAFDLIYLGGQANTVPKAIAVNLPNDEQIQLEQGTRTLQLKNTMRAKFDHIVMPMADRMVQPSQRAQVRFDSFFSNTMLHELAHGLGIKHTLDGRPVRQALAEQAMIFEEAKADLVGLHLLSRLREMGIWSQEQWLQGHITSLVSIFRSIRFGTGSAHGMANLMRFNYLRERSVLLRDEKGRYALDMDRIGPAVDAMVGELLKLQGDGDHNAIKRFMERYGKVGNTLASDLKGMREAGLLEDVAFIQKRAFLRGL